MKTKRISLLTVAALMGATPFAVPFTITTARAEVAAPAEMASLYGLAARLPKDTEGFAALYRLSDLWHGLLNSNLAKTVLANEELMRNMDLDDIQRAWENDEEMRMGFTLAGQLLGSEIMIATPRGFAKEMSNILKNISVVQTAFLGVRVKSGGDEGMPVEMLPAIEAVATMNVPPVIFAAKAGAAKDQLSNLIAMALGQMPEEAARVIKRNTFSQDGIEFQSLSISGEAVPDDDKEKMLRDLKRATKDDAKAEALAKKLLSKSIELSWGWMGDYLIIGIGSGHGHVKFASSAADSVLMQPALAPRAAAWAAKKPFGLSYSSQEAMRTINDAGNLVDSLGAYGQMAKMAGVPVNVDRILDSLRQLSKKSGDVWPNDPDAAAGALWWDGGLHAEAFGGNKPRWFDNTQPLSLGSLAGERTVFLSQSRANEAHRDKVFGLFEEVVTAVFAIYQEEVKPHLPNDAKQATAMGEMVGVPLIKQLWAAIGNFRSALGSERGIIVNLDGAFPDLPGNPMPVEVREKSKFPRIAILADLKDKEKLTASWGGLKDILGSVAALIGSSTGTNINTKPVARKAGGVDIYGFELPVDTGDLWPHTAVSPTRWMFSTSPSFTAELAAKTTAPAGPALGHHTLFNATALWNYAEEWLKLLPMEGEGEANAKLALRIARTIERAEMKLGAEGGQSHDQAVLKISDLK